MLGGMALARKMGYGEVHDLAEILAYVGAALTGINLRKGWAYLRMGDDDAVRKSFNSSLDDRVEKD